MEHNNVFITVAALTLIFLCILLGYGVYRAYFSERSSIDTAIKSLTAPSEGPLVSEDVRASLSASFPSKNDSLPTQTDALKSLTASQ